MATSSSGGSTPARDKSVTPTPTQHNDQTAGGTLGGTASTPSPKTVATRFVFTYFKTLLTNPEQIHRLYQPSSVLSVGVGSIPAATSTFDALSPTNPRDRLFACTDKDEETINNDCIIKFEIDKDSIDAQQSVDNAILLVVIGHVVFLKPDESETLVARKSFIHTFFLRTVPAAVGSKVSYYVHNDILRFSHPTERIDQSTTTAPACETVPTITSMPSAVVANETMAENLNESRKSAGLPETISGTTTILEAKEEKIKDVAVSVLAVDDAPGGGVEESKEIMVDEDDDEDVAILTTLNVRSTQNGTVGAVEKYELENVNEETAKPDVKRDSASALGKKSVTATNDESKHNTSASPSKQANAKPSSWASLFSSGGVSKSPSVGSPNRPKPVAPIASLPVVQSVPVPVKQSKTTNSQPVLVPADNAVAIQIDETSKTIPVPAEKVVDATKDTNTRVVPQTMSAQSTKLVGNDTYRRDPDSTLVIRNLHSDATEKDIMRIFERFATDINGRVIRCTVHADRAIAFMDYDSPEPVLTAIAMHKDEPFVLLDRKLHIYQKIQANQINQGGGGGGSKSNTGDNRGAVSGRGKNGSARSGEISAEAEPGGRAIRSGGSSGNSGRGIDSAGRGNYRRVSGGEGGRGRMGRGGR